MDILYAVFLIRSNIIWRIIWLPVTLKNVQNKNNKEELFQIRDKIK